MEVVHIVTSTGSGLECKWKGGVYVCINYVKRIPAGLL